jgi:hypothetical protein
MRASLILAPRMAGFGAQRKLGSEVGSFRFCPLSGHTAPIQLTESGSGGPAAGAVLGDGDRDGPSSLGIL